MSFVAATAELATRDKVMAGLIRRAGPFKIPKPTDDNFTALAESIAYQQLNGKAAATIWGRVVVACGGAVSPDSLLMTPEAALRGAGLSGNKFASMRDLALKVWEGDVPLEGIDRLSDDEVVERLVAVRGIGRWTAEMFLMFQLRRLDVWPVDDYGVRNGWKIAYKLSDMPKPRDLQELGERFRGVRSVAAWYCWRAVDLARGT